MTSYQGHIENGVVVFDEPVSIPEGTAVRVEAFASPGKRTAERAKNAMGGRPGENSECFHDLAPARPLDAQTKEAMRALLTKKQYQALVEVVEQGGPDVDAIRKLRAASLA